MLDTALDIFRIRQYFNVITRTRQAAEAVRDDMGALTDLRRAMLPLPFDPKPAGGNPFPPAQPFRSRRFAGKRVALMATGGSGAMASLVGAARALEEAGITPTVITLCSGSAMFGFPLAAGMPAQEVAEFVLSLAPTDYIDVGWRRMALLVPTVGRGFGGFVDGDRLEAVYRQLLGDRTLGELAIPAFAPVWSVEHNQLEYLGPTTHPDLPVARAVRMAVALPLLIQPVEMDGGWWCDGGIVDIFPVRPVLALDPPCDAALAVNGFYPPGFVGEDASGWRDHLASILDIASQIRTSQQVELARENVSRLRAALDVAMIEPVAYEQVRGMGFYRQFVNTSDWPEFMRAGRTAARGALRAARPDRRRA